jgi:CHAT domain-containing protein
LVALNPEVQFSFRESVEPVYRQLVDLLLRSENGDNSNSARSQQANRDHLIQARQVMEALQLAELDNFFGDACVQTKQVNIDQLEPHQPLFTQLFYQIVWK